MGSDSMKRIILLLIFLGPFALPASEARAARGLLLLGGLSNQLDFEYRFDGEQTKSDRGSSRREHYFLESFRTQMPYAVIDPLILHGTIDLNLELDQTYATTSGNQTSNSSGTGFRYSYNGIILDRSAFPASFFGRSERVHAQREFAAPYDILIDSFGVGLRIKNLSLPLSVNYIRTTTETQGLTTDRTQTGDSLSVQASHKFRGFSDTDASLLFSSNASEPMAGGAGFVDDRRYDVSLHNRLNFSQPNKERSLSSNVTKHEERSLLDALMAEQRTLQLEEELYWAMGRGLVFGSHYSLINRDATDIDSRNRDSRVWLQHHLFESLTTRVEGEYRTNAVVTSGTEANRSLALDLAYNKKLPDESALQLSYRYFYQETDRNQKEFTGVAIDEPRTVVAGVLPGIAAPFLLENSAVLADTIVIRNANPAVHLSPYVLNVDYTIEQAGLLTRIVPTPTSEIHVGDNLLLNYNYLTNPQVVYGTTSNSVNADLMLFNNAYRFYTRYTSSSQNLISGSADVIRLTNQNEYWVGFEKNKLSLSFGGEYNAADSDQDQHQAVTGFVRSQFGVGRGNLALYANDTYTNTEPNTFSSSQKANQVNSFGCGSVYTARIWHSVQMMLTGRYLNSSGDIPTRNDISLGADLSWSFGNMVASLVSQVNWRQVPGITTQDEYVRIKITRYF